jgi:hypothetical protein
MINFLKVFMARMASKSRVKDKNNNTNNTIDTCKIMSYVFVLAHSILVIDPKIESVIPCLTRNPDAVPAKAGNYRELGSCFHRKPWSPHPPIKDFEGRQVRNDDRGHFYAGVNK